jgi:hypothetical protein
MIYHAGRLVFVSSIAALFELHNSRVELALSNSNVICRFYWYARTSSRWGLGK